MERNDIIKEHDNLSERKVEEHENSLEDASTNLRCSPAADSVVYERTSMDDDESTPVSKKAKLEKEPLPTEANERVASISTSTGSFSASVQEQEDDDDHEKEDQSSTDDSSDQSDGTESHDDEEKDRNEESDQKGSSSSEEDFDGDEQVLLDSEQLDLDDDEDEEDASLFRRIIAAAAANGIPLEYLAAHGIHLPIEDDEPVEYPFGEAPTSLDDVAKFIQSDRCKRILCLTGAGMSVASGIPDFRSSNGLYATLDATKLTATEEQIEAIEENPSFSLDQHLFMENPLPCLEVNREFILGVQERKWKATLAHRFIELLQTKTNGGKGKLVRLYTQNIDGLEDQCIGIGHERRIAVHGSMDEAECANCNAKMDFDHFCGLVRSQIKDITGQDPSAPKESSAIVCESCGRNTVKPSIVLFRSKLPDVFFNSVPIDVKDIDLLIIMGTSLAVAPANSIVWRIPKSAMRVLINRERVGWHLGLDFQSNDRDFLASGNCENVALDLMEKLGWLEDLRPLLDRNELPESSALLLRQRLEELEQKPSPKQDQNPNDKNCQQQ
ncbi:silent information regulator protein Sir2 [Nitzschia inconspicua]|uniref:Silent information regulator protein Sir2 n=1 Tax=Nitzschia inconspicua TaxID=303405 RepID=A0A9K3KPG7_9STRA|nr:silent information regulator protein Sir2 [Nitzschia inconspicua]